MIKDEKIPINADEYLEVDELRFDIQEYIQAPEEFLRMKPLRDRRRQEERDFMEMNDLQDTLPPVKDNKKDKPAGAEGGVLDD
jgi:hypothetical protein